MPMDREGGRVEQALRAWAEAPVPLDDAAAAEERRRRVVAATALAIARSASVRSQERRRLRIGVALGAAAAVLAVAGVAWRGASRLRHPAEETTASIAQVQLLAGSVRRSHPDVPLAGNTTDGRLPLGPGDEVMTEAKGGHGEVAFVDGVAITVESGSLLRLPDTVASSAVPQANERVGLDAGSVFVRVPPQPRGHTFSVQTPDTLVTVHGTAFAVDVTRPAGQSTSVTRVRVSSGVVSVATGGGPEVFLTAGMEWSSSRGDDGPRTATPAPAKESSLGDTSASPAPSAVGASSVPSHRGHAPAPTPNAARETRDANSANDTNDANASTLGEENRLLASATAASKVGDYRGAASTLDDLLRRFPLSPLAQEAHVQRFRALERSGDVAGAAREARSYLSLYPNGSAREEAKRVAVGP
jgi:ferric-dicitrate binding protein FerR (iron transport regulator)